MLDYSEQDFILLEDEGKIDSFLELEQEGIDEVSLDELEQSVRQGLIELEEKIEKLLEFVEEETGDRQGDDLALEESDRVQHVVSE